MFIPYNKKAFTLVELVFVIVIIGILSAVLAPRFNRPALTEAAHQVVSHIRYTQHLAMVDNKFDPTNKDWFQERWQIRFFENVTFRRKNNNKTYTKIWSYSIYSDNPTYTHKPNKKELARNPQNRNQFLCGGYNNTLEFDDEQAMKSLRLRDEYGIKDMIFGGGCKARSKYIIYDYLGRPYNGYITSSSPFDKLIKTRCTIDMCVVDRCEDANSDEKITIAIEPETGYTHIL